MVARVLMRTGSPTFRLCCGGLAVQISATAHTTMTPAIDQLQRRGGGFATA